MTHCAQARRMFGPYWDDEVTQAEREWLEAHLAGCTACRTEYEQLARTLELVGSLPRHEPPADLAERALASARRAAPAPDRIAVGSSLPAWAPVAAGVAIVALVAATLAPYFLASRGGAPLARRESPVPEPRLVAAAPPAAREGGPASRVSGARSATSVADSLFDHSADVEFILDPVQLRRGRAHTVARLPDGTRGDQAVISF